MFGKKRRKAEAELAAGESAEAQVDAVDEAETTSDAGEQEAGEQTPSSQETPAFDRAFGPFDISEVADTDGLLDLGAILAKPMPGVELRIEVDEKSGQPMAITAVRGRGAVQVRAFAGPRSGGGWQTSREEIRKQLDADQGRVQEVTGPFGAELLAGMPATSPQGEQVIQPVRFAGVEGPRWLLQGVFLGEGAIPEHYDDVNEVFRSFVVNRGDSPMPPGTVLKISLPDTAEDADAEEEQARDTDILERGPEITEIR